MPKKKVDITLTEAKTPGDAMNYIFIGPKYFLIKHTLKTLLALAIMVSGPCYIGWQYFNSDVISIEEAKPIKKDKPIGANFSLFSQAIAAAPH